MKRKNDVSMAWASGTLAGICAAWHELQLVRASGASASAERDALYCLEFVLADAATLCEPTAGDHMAVTLGGYRRRAVLYHE
jgi:hypothetical protein